MKRFAVFIQRIRIRHDSPSNRKLHPAILQREGADQNAAVKIAHGPRANKLPQ